MNTDPNFPLPHDGGPDDLPRTLRRERDAREREAREREAREQGHLGHEPAFIPDGSGGYAQAPYASASLADPPAARVTRFDVPFGHMVSFFLKAALATIPAILLLTAILWALGHLVQLFFPQLLKMQILIWFPNT